MIHADPVPTEEGLFTNYVANLYTKLVGAPLSPAAVLAASLNIPAADLTTLTNINNMLSGMRSTVEQIQQRTKDVNAFWRWFLRGPVDPNAPVNQAFPLTLSWPAYPTLVSGNAISWVSKFVTRLRSQPNATPAVRADLHLEGAAQSAPDASSWKPNLEHSYNAGHPVIEWKRKPGARLEIWVDRGDASGFHLLDIDDVPDYTDMHPLPAAGVAAIWKYKGIYRVNGAQVGAWSDVHEVSVHG